jgi:hypothetical protein
LIDIGRAARAPRDRADVDVAIIDVPAVLALGMTLTGDELAAAVREARRKTRRRLRVYDPPEFGSLKKIRRIQNWTSQVKSMAHANICNAF